MTTTSIGQARSHGRRATQDKRFEWLARAGLVARGAIYAIVGLLAIQVALGDGGKTTDQQGALKTVAEQPFGKVLLVLMAIGLAGYALWRLTRAALGHGVECDDDAKARIDGVVSGVAYAGLCFTAVKLLAGSGGGGGGGGGADKTTGGVLGWPGGTWIVGIIGVIVVGVGLEQGYKGIKRKFCESAKTGEMSRHTRRAYELVGLAGHLARMVVFGLIGVFLVKAALEFDPDKAVTLDGALAKVAHAPAGPVLLGVVAAGLMAFAAFSFMDARYRRV
jgi:hypothetical protein